MYIFANLTTMSSKQTQGGLACCGNKKSPHYNIIILYSEHHPEIHQSALTLRPLTTLLLFDPGMHAAATPQRHLCNLRSATQDHGYTPQKSSDCVLIGKSQVCLQWDLH